jgi:Uma2 family endonuclease
MTLTGKQMTVEELWRLPDDGMRHELIDGELKTMAPNGREHGRVAMRFGARLNGFVEQHELGEVWAAETGFVLARAPDVVRAPDVAFVRRERLGAGGAETGYFPGAPDLAVEVVSPNDRAGDIEAKVATWLEHGTRLVIVVYPRTRSARVHRPGELPRELSEADSIEGGDVVPGWVLPLRELFA